MLHPLAELTLKHNPSWGPKKSALTWRTPEAKSCGKAPSHVGGPWTTISSVNLQELPQTTFCPPQVTSTASLRTSPVSSTKTLGHSLKIPSSISGAKVPAAGVAQDSV